MANRVDRSVRVSLLRHVMKNRFNRNTLLQKAHRARCFFTSPTRITWYFSLSKLIRCNLWGNVQTHGGEISTSDRTADFSAFSTDGAWLRELSLARHRPKWTTHFLAAFAVYRAEFLGRLSGRSPQSVSDRSNFRNPWASLPVRTSSRKMPGRFLGTQSSNRRPAT